MSKIPIFTLRHAAFTFLYPHIQNWNPEHYLEHYSEMITKALEKAPGHIILDGRMGDDLTEQVYAEIIQYTKTNELQPVIAIYEPRSFCPLKCFRIQNEHALEKFVDEYSEK